MIYLAPLQGFTDFVYRKVYDKVFDGIDKFFIPYLSVKNNEVLKKYQKEILPENNPQKVVIPQVLPKNENELLFLSEYLAGFNYQEINLNMGCPYPMVTNRGKGSGLLAQPKTVDRILNHFFKNTDLKLSVKLRAGLASEHDIEKIIPILNAYPISEVILHPRIATQLYKGKIFDSAIQFTAKTLTHRLVYNGDIFSKKDSLDLGSKHLKTDDLMVGRGVLMDPFLPSELKNVTFSDAERLKKLQDFHDEMLNSYIEIMDNEGNALNKMKQFWIYFNHNFTPDKKVLKRIKKCKNIGRYKQELAQVFSSIPASE